MTFGKLSTLYQVAQGGQGVVRQHRDTQRAPVRQQNAPPPATPGGDAIRQQNRDAYQRWLDSQNQPTTPTPPTPPATPPMKDLYQQYLTDIGMGGDYPVTYGQTPKGNYSGFNTQTALDDAVQGRAYEQWLQAQDQASGLAQQYFDWQKQVQANAATLEQNYRELHGAVQPRYNELDPSVGGALLHQYGPGGDGVGQAVGWNDRIGDNAVLKQTEHVNGMNTGHFADTASGQPVARTLNPTGVPLDWMPQDVKDRYSSYSVPDVVPTALTNQWIADGSTPGHDVTTTIPIGQQEHDKRAGNYAGAEQYAKDLQAWMDTQNTAWEPYQQLAVDMAGTPYSDYAQLVATRDYGVDPNIAAWRYGAPSGTDADLQQQAVTDWLANRDQQYLDQYGVPYDVYHQQQTDQRTAANQAYTDQQRADAEAAQYVTIGGDQVLRTDARQVLFDSLGVDSKQLAASANVTEDQLFNLLDQPDVQDAIDGIRTAIANQDDATVSALLTQVATSNPTLFHVIKSIYGADAVPDDWSLYGR